jgi:acetyl-CoA carboxylase biotin carboxyl carrier protein
MSGGVRFDPEAIRTLAMILADTGLTEIEIAENDSRIRVVRAHPPVAAVSYQDAARMMAPPPMGVAAPAAAAAPAATAAPAEEDLSKHPGAVSSPMVGVAYLAPEPGAAPYITIGAQVAAGQTVLLIEAMKTFNQIKAPKSGTVSRILVASGAPVEYGEVLLVID